MKKEKALEARERILHGLPLEKIYLIKGTWKERDDESLSSAYARLLY